VFIDEDGIADLNAPTLFLSTRYLDRGQVRGLLSDRLARHISAVRTGRVVDVGMEFRNSGWFGAHWQLQLIARAYGLALLRAGDNGDAVYAAVNPQTGQVSIAAPGADDAVTIGGPLLPARTLVLEPGEPTTLYVDPACAAHLARYPETYTSTLDDRQDVIFTPDRESALERVMARDRRRSRGSRPRSRVRRQQRVPRAPQTH
jgi:hypothetical protein